jgi:Zn-dependent protease with chaperone function
MCCLLQEAYMSYNKTEMWKMRIHIFFMKLLALFVSTAIFAGIGYTLFKIEGNAFIDEFLVSACFLILFYSLHYYIIKLIVNVREADEIQDAKLYAAFNQVCILAHTNNSLSKPKLYILEEDGINAFTWGINIPYLYGAPLIGSCIAISRGCVKSCDHIALLGIIGHEFGHIKAMDSFVANISKLQSLIGSKLPNFLKGAKLSIFNIWIYATWLSLGLLLPLIGRLYSQEAERAADLYSVRLLDSPDPIITGLNQIMTDLKIEDQRDDIMIRLNSSHPVIHQRLTYLLELKLF